MTLPASRWFSILLITVFAICGCGKKGPPTSKVSGTVTFQGKPLDMGVIDLESSTTGAAAQASIMDGQFEFEVPVKQGSYKVMINPPPSPPPGSGLAPPPDPKEIPPKYRSLATTDLKAEIKDGKNELTFDMKP